MVLANVRSTDTLEISIWPVLIFSNIFTQCFSMTALSGWHAEPATFVTVNQSSEPCDCQHFQTITLSDLSKLLQHVFFFNSCWLWMLSVFWGLAVIFLSFASPPTNKIVSFSMPQLYKANKKMLPCNTLLFHAFLLVLKSFKEHKNGHGEITSNDYELTMSHPKSDMRLFRMNILF